MTYHTIIGIDPGKCTGLFLYKSGKTEHHEMALPQAGDWLWSWLLSGSVDLVVHERFIVSPGGGARTMQLDALGVIGVAQFLCHRTKTDLAVVSKSDALKLASNDRLRQAGWWGRGFTHANDAARVAMAAYAPRNPAWFADILRGAQCRP